MSSPSDAPLGSPGSPGGRILVVDDDPVTRRVLSSILERAHYDVMASTDGHEAWTELAAARIDLVITDREMPAMNGLELLRAVRQSPRHGGVPVIMLTGTTLETRRRRGRRRGRQRLPHQAGELARAARDRRAAAARHDRPGVGGRSVTRRSGSRPLPAGALRARARLLRLRPGQPGRPPRPQHRRRRRRADRDLAPRPAPRSVPRRPQRRHHRHAPRLPLQLGGGARADAPARRRSSALHRHRGLRDPDAPSDADDGRGPPARLGGRDRGRSRDDRRRARRPAARSPPPAAAASSR